MAGGVRAESRSIERQVDNLSKRLKVLERMRPPNKINQKGKDAYDKAQITRIIETLDRVILELEKINA